MKAEVVRVDEVEFEEEDDAIDGKGKIILDSHEVLRKALIMLNGSPSLHLLKPSVTQSNHTVLSKWVL